MSTAEVQDLHGVCRYKYVVQGSDTTMLSNEI